ncbi:MAG: aminoacyl-tRNA hydrolase [Nevskia sp.]|jgi:ribosome-associated protein|nr:aminoacyl-tRNA hydrolase [Nevskia sp.]
MLKINPNLNIPLAEIELSAMRAQGAGGQHVNTTASAIHLRFDITASSLSDEQKQRLLERADQRVTRDGVIVIKAQQHRSQELNRAAALERLAELIASGLHVPRKRVPTKPSRAARQRRVDGKVQRGRVKALRRTVSD